eukprot:11602913-Heterocapsa_arctica.AAC.2
MTSTAPRGHLGGGAESLVWRLRLCRFHGGFVEPQAIELAPSCHRTLDLRRQADRVGRDELVVTPHAPSALAFGDLERLEALDQDVARAIEVARYQAVDRLGEGPHLAHE